MKTMTVRDIMSSELTTIDTGEKLSDVWRLMQHRHIHHVPVVDGERPVGMISAIDIMRLAADMAGSDDRRMSAMLDYHYSIDDAMTPDLVTVGVEADVRKAAEALADGSIHSVLVVDDGGDLVGIVTTTDLVQMLLRVI